MLSIELFGGAGLAASGLEEAGCEHVAIVEMDPTACESLRANFPHAEIIERDAGRVDYRRFVGVDLLWASPPCQPYSKAGKGLGADDPRDGWPATLRAIEQCSPRWVIIENVDGVPADQWCADLVALGYNCTDYRLLNAVNFGVPQHRRRVFIIAGPDAIDWPAETHRKPSKQVDIFDTRRPWVSSREALGLGLYCFATDPRCDPGPAAQRRIRDLSDRPSVCLGAYDRGINQGGQPWTVAPSPTISTADGQGVGGQRGRAALEKQIGRRKLTVAECRTLQGVHSSHILCGNTRAQYRQIGNGVPPIMAQLLAEAVLAADDQEYRRVC